VAASIARALTSAESEAVGQKIVAAVTKRTGASLPRRRASSLSPR
jgi:hypothetical protein